jgi:hypothetical protein
MNRNPTYALKAEFVYFYVKYQMHRVPCECGNHLGKVKLSL